jgi:hypothetical protein
VPLDRPLEGAELGELALGELLAGLLELGLLLEGLLLEGLLELPDDPSELEPPLPDGACLRLRDATRRMNP